MIAAGGMSAVILYRYTNATQERIEAEPITMETAHLAVLEPHEHGPEDSVSDEWHHETLVAPSLEAPRDMYVTGLYFQLVNAPTSTVHHMSLTDSSRKNLTCPNFPTGAELFSYSADRMYENTVQFPEGYALFIPKGTPLSMYLMAHNPAPPLGTGDTFYDVYTKIQFLESTARPSTLKLVTPYLLHLDDVPCAYGKADGADGIIFTVPPSTKAYAYSGQGKSDPAASFEFKKPATLVNLTGHLHAHQGAKELIVHKNDPVMHTFRPSSSDDPFFFPLQHATSTFRVAAGDRVWLTAVYDNDYDVPARGAMGAVGFYYAEDTQSFLTRFFSDIIGK